MKFLIEISTQKRDIPTRLPGVDNPGVDYLLANGWRYADDATIPALTEGVTRSEIQWADSGDSVNAVAVYTERATADIESEQAAITKAASLERWIMDNAFLLVCNAYFGTVEKRGTTDLLKKAFEIVAVDQVAGMRAFAVVIGLDKELVRVGGDRWWDTCVWHQDADAIAGAQAMLAEMGAT